MNPSPISYGNVLLLGMLGDNTSPLKKWALKPHDMMELWQCLVEKVPTQALDMVAITMRNLWLILWVFKNKFGSPQKLMQSASGQLDDFLYATVPEKEEHLQSRPSQPSIPRFWKRP